MQQLWFIDKTNNSTCFVDHCAHLQECKSVNYCIWFSAFKVLAGVLGHREAGRVHCVEAVFINKSKLLRQVGLTNHLVLGMHGHTNIKAGIWVPVATATNEWLAAFFEKCSSSLYMVNHVLSHVYLTFFYFIMTFLPVSSMMCQKQQQKFKT